MSPVAHVTMGEPEYLRVWEYLRGVFKGLLHNPPPANAVGAGIGSTQALGPGSGVHEGRPSCSWTPPRNPTPAAIPASRQRTLNPEAQEGAATGITASVHCRACWSSGPRGGRSSSAPAPPPPLCRPRAPPTPARPPPCARFPLARPLPTHTHRTRRHVPPDPGGGGRDPASQRPRPLGQSVALSG